jgi:hypothetical protein
VLNDSEHPVGGCFQCHESLPLRSAVGPLIKVLGAVVEDESDLKIRFQDTMKVKELKIRRKKKIYKN